jgi:MYXO-CTERM domain-containing protein
MKLSWWQFLGRLSASACALTVTTWVEAACADDASAPSADAGAANIQDGAGDAPDAGTTGWLLTFNDEFDGTAIDTCKWQFRYKWGERVINHELEAYVSQADESQAFTLDQGVLHIVGRKQPGTYAGQTLSYTSGLLVSFYEQKYGFFETRSRMPKGSGLWPAFWLLHANGYPDIHEIDVLEWISPNPTIVYMTDHFGTSYAMDHWSQFLYRSPDVSDAFHTYGVDWESDRIVFYVDGVEIGRTTDPGQLHDTPMYVITNLAIGGNLPGNPSQTAVFPASYDIDFIRVYQRDGSNPTALPPPDSVASLSDAGPCLAPPDTDASVDAGAVDANADAALPAPDAGSDASVDAGVSQRLVIGGGCACSTQTGSASSLFVGAAAFGAMLGLGILRGRRRRRTVLSM